ncbi:MAG: hypothetical protein GX100_09315 [candidate division WS1 bacterium]|nr:hypothetical protein [candidate division WS1 bacterium]
MPHRIAALFIVALVVANLLSGPAPTAASPAIFWASDPVRPGEVVLVQGGNWGEAPFVELSWLRDDRPGVPGSSATSRSHKVEAVIPLQANSSTVKFLLPPSWYDGVYALRVKSGESFSAPVLLNAPDIWWPQGDWGAEASPGGWLRIFGKSLSFSGKAQVLLRGAGKDLTLTPTVPDAWSLTLNLPANLVPGEYQVWVHNTRGGPDTWRSAGSMLIKPHPPLWKPDVFDVRDYGAQPNSPFEATVAIQAALDAAGENGGGIVHLPRGRFQINATLCIPRFVLLRGAGADLTQLYWRDRVQPLDTLIQGTNSFGCEDFSVFAVNHIGGVAADDGSKPEAGNVFLRRLKLHLNRFEQVSAAEAGRRLLPMGGQGTHGPNAISGGGENFQCTDCEIYSSRSPFAFSGLRHGLIRNNRCFQGDTAHGIGGSQVIFEDNAVLGGPVARGGYDYVQRDCYFARNRIGQMSLADAEIFTTDGGNTQQVNLSGSGVRFTLDADVNWRTWTRSDSRPVYLFITNGTGVGQYRRIISYNGRDLELDQPWAVPPDDTSTVTLCPAFTRYLVIDNEFHDGAIVQDYTWGMDWIFAGNRLARVGGIHNAGRGKIPNWYTQYFANEIMVGSSTRGPWNEQPPTDAHLQVIGDSARCAIFRHNLLHNNARLAVTQRVHDVVLERNTVRDADVGIEVATGAQGIVLWRNQFERVAQPLSGVGEQVLMHPVERLLDRLLAAGVIPADLQADRAWSAALQKLAKLQEHPLGAEGLQESMQACQLELLQAAATALPEGQSLDLLQALTGLTLQEASSPALQILLTNGSGGTAETSLLTSLPAWSSPLTLTLAFSPLPGWQFPEPQPLALKPDGSVTAKPTLTLPVGTWGKPHIPVSYTATGDGWALHGAGRLQLGTRGSSDYLTQWMIVGPFEAEKPGVLGETVYPPERRLDVAAVAPGLEGEVRWEPVSLATAPYIVDFTKLYGPHEKGVAFGVAVLRVKRPTTVAITTNPPGGSTYAAGVTYLNGERIGTPDRYQARQVSRTLPAGDNVLLIGVAQTGNTWRLSAQVEVSPAAEPGDVQIVPADQLLQVAALTPPPLADLPQGPDLPFSGGHDWKPVYEDDFNRDKLGPEWVPYEPQAWYEGQSWALRSGHLASGASSYFEYLTYAFPVSAPLRIECDLTGAPDRDPASLIAFTLTPRNQVGNRRLWGDVNGAGYMMTVGWNPPMSNHLWRQEKELLANAEGPFMEIGKTKHVIAQFAPPHLLLVVDGQVSLEHTDPDWLPGLDAFSLMNGFGRDWIDNLRIYTAAE